MREIRRAAACGQCIANGLASREHAAMRLVVLSCSLVLALAGCPTPEPYRDAGVAAEDAGVVDEDVVAAADYCESIVDFFCPYYVRCGRMAASSVDECREVFLPACNARFEPSYESLEAEGLLHLSRAGLDACAAHLDDVACEQQLLDLDGPCAAMWKGTQPAGAACGFDIESFVCEPGTACVLDLTFCGTCRPVVADGASCADTDPVLGDVTCARESTCDDDTCLARKRVGELCAAGDRCVLGAICNSDGVCAGPTYAGVGDTCDNFDNRCPFRAECLEDQCRLAGTVGDTCDAITPCDSGAFCEGDVCVELVPQGGSCDASVQCQSGICAESICAVLPSACFP